MFRSINRFVFAASVAVVAVAVAAVAANQCDPIVGLFVNIWPFETMKLVQ